MNSNELKRIFYDILFNPILPIPIMNLGFFTRTLNWTVGLDIEMWIHYITLHVNLSFIITAFVNHRLSL